MTQSATRTRPALTDPEGAYTLPALLTRLIGSPTGRLYSVLGPASVWVPLVLAVLAGLLRFWNLDQPHQLIFDETYYVKDGYSYLHFGYEREWPKDINDAFANGTATPQAGPEYVVHPPLGKWIIALGMAVFGTSDGLGWRAGSALAGTLAVLVTTLAAQRLFRAVAPAALVGLFMAVDGQMLVLSRTGILDIFVCLFAILAFALALKDRDDGRRRLARWVAARAEAGGSVGNVGALGAHAASGSALERRLDRALAWGPGALWRPWRLALGVSLGGLCAVKWSGLAIVAVTGLLVVWWDCQARRSVGIKHWLAGGVLRDGLLGFVLIIPTALVTYLITWTGWFLHPGAYGHGAEASATGAARLIPEPLRDLWAYHAQAYAFHQGLDSPHPSASNPWTWLFAGRPVLFQYDSSQNKSLPCHAGQACQQVISDLPNPVLWWAGTAALLVVLWAFIGRRDWRALAILSGAVGGYLPWLFYPFRTMFFFYTSAYEPFMIMGVVYALWILCLPSGASPRRRRIGLAVILGFTAVVLAVSWWFWPIWTGETITPLQYRLRMWLPSW